MIRTAHRSTRLLEGVLESARCRSGRAAFSISEFRLDQIVRDAADAVSAAAKEKGVAIHAEADAGLPPVNSDPDKVEQVLLNLLTNAIKYTPRKGSIRLRASRPEAGVSSIVQSLGGGAPFDADRFVQVTVEDTGVGIPSRDLERIFERFSRAHAEPESSLSSFGLGLWICRDIVTELGGRLCIQSEANVGTRVSVLVPLQFDPAVAKASEEEPSR
jgi:two-component system sensor histidine kinase VicK